MDKIDLQQIINNYPDCVTNGAELKAILLDTYPDMSKAMVNTLVIIVNDGIAKEILDSEAITGLDKFRWQKKLEDDYGLSEKVITSGIDMFVECRDYCNPDDFEIKNGVLISYKGSYPIVHIPSNVTIIGDKAFYSCSRLTSITIPDSVTSIGNYSFYGCRELTSVTIGNSITSIGNYAFVYCSGLRSITIQESVTSIGDYSFYGCAGLARVEWNAVNCTEAGNEKYPIFRGCTNLTTVIIGDKVKIIPSYAFDGCTGLTSIEWNAENCTYAGDYYSPIFSEWINLTTVIIGDKVKVIPSCAFEGCGELTNIHISSIESWCKIIRKDNLMDHGTRNKKLYINGEEITELIIPDNVTSIGNSAFRGCTGLTSIMIPDSVTSIGDYAFYGCDKLTNIHISSIESWCKITGLDNLMRYGSSNKKLYINGEEITELIIPDCVTNIGSWAFYNSRGLTSITIPDSVTSIGDCAFSSCTGLKSVAIGNGITSIGLQAFRNCTGLTSITIPESVTSIGNSAINSERDFRKTQQKIPNKIENSLQMIA